MKEARAWRASFMTEVDVADQAAICSTGEP